MMYKIHLQNRSNREEFMNISMGNLDVIMFLIKIYSDVENDIFITGLRHFPIITYPLYFINVWLIKNKTLCTSTYLFFLSFFYPLGLHNSLMHITSGLNLIAQAIRVKIKSYTICALSNISIF